MEGWPLKISPWKCLLLVGALSLALNLFSVGYVWLAPEDEVLGYGSLLNFVLFGCCLAVPVLLVLAVISVFQKFLRAPVLFGVGCAVVWFAVWLPCDRARNHFWRRGYTALAQRSRPLVDAIKRYEKERGKPPADLKSLVPSYIAVMPPAPPGCSEYDLQLGKYGQPWVLYVYTPVWGVGFDRFEYWPGEVYPEEGESGWYEPIEDWAYYHE